ncbi:hypothetical protein ACP4OV_018313 [Aristida adscensionis]
MAVPAAFLAGARRAGTLRGSPAHGPRRLLRADSFPKRKPARKTPEKAKKGGHSHPKYPLMQPVSRREYQRIRRSITAEEQADLELRLGLDGWDSPGYALPPLKNSPEKKSRSPEETLSPEKARRATPPPPQTPNRITRSSGSGGSGAHLKEKTGPKKSWINDVLKSSATGRNAELLISARDFKVQDQASSSKSTRGRCKEDWKRKAWNSHGSEDDEDEEDPVGRKLFEDY